MPKRNSRLALLRRIALRLLLGLAALGLPAVLSRPAHSFTPEPDLESQRETLHARVARVRAALEIELRTPVEKERKSRIAQWYNWGNWQNGWDNNWKDWQNQWSNY